VYSILLLIITFIDRKIPIPGVMILKNQNQKHSIHLSAFYNIVWGKGSVAILYILNSEVLVSEKVNFGQSLALNGHSPVTVTK